MAQETPIERIRAAIPEIYQRDSTTIALLVADVEKLLALVDAARALQNHLKWPPTMTTGVSGLGNRMAIALSALDTPQA